jgi:type I restriction enzyme, R subunit
MTTSTPRHSEAAFENVIEAHLVQQGHVSVDRDGSIAIRALLPKTS